MKYPLDSTTFVDTVNHLVENDKAQNVVIQKMGEVLESAMDASETDDAEWYTEAESILKDLHSLKMYHESRRFNEANGHFDNSKSGMAGIFRENSTPDDAQGELSEDDLAKHFKEKRQTKKPKEQEKQLKDMTLQEIEAWESAQDNSNDIYKIKARVANLARGPGVSLTPQGEMLVNTYVHVLKSLYDFADKLEDKMVKIELVNLLRSHEIMPGTLISAAGAGVRQAKKDDV